MSPVAQKQGAGIRLAGLQFLPASLPDHVPAPLLDQMQITFQSPLTQGDAATIGKSLEQLIAGSPLFSPIEGLPDAVWKGKECKACHKWEQEALCTQGGTYLNVKTAAAIDKKHPYGGSFKQNLRTWAQQGCP